MRAVLQRRDRQRRVTEAARARRAGDAAGAVDILAAVLVEDADHVGANAEMARALRLLDDPVGAEAHLRTALAGVLDYGLVVELAQAMVEQGRVEEAEELLDSALVMADGNPRLDPGEALIVRATIAHAQERDEDARAALDLIVPKRASALTKRYAERLRADLEPERVARGAAVDDDVTSEVGGGLARDGREPAREHDPAADA